MKHNNDRFAPIFAVGVAAQLAQMHPQTLRQYDRIGLVSPQRTRGGTRRYSGYDIERLRHVALLSGEGLSLEGIRRVLALNDRVRDLEDRVQELEESLAREMLKRPEKRVFAAGVEGEVVTLRRGTRTQRRTEVVVWRPGARG
ncbi:MAG TPA: MerR family transcriptional regulator [Microbacteriaceae bacterium]|nr:MerR family transcriptional regulator [Microbacteriaceae bacterium]